MEFKEICTCMHAYAEAAGAGPLSLSLYTLPKKFAPLLDKEAPSFSLSLSVSTKGAEIQNLHCLCSQRNNHLNPRCFFPLTLGITAGQWDCRGPHCWPWSEI